LIGVLRSLCATLLEGLQYRLSLWAADWAAELRRITTLLYWLWVSVFFLMLATGLLVAAALMAFWDQRAWITLLLAFVAIVVWGISLWQWQSVLRRPREPWAATLEQLRRDRNSF
jgi:uncharacterized membrane protein YqjE